MARNRDYIPRPLAQFNEWYANLINYIKQVTFVQDNPWTHIPDEKNNAFVHTLFVTNTGYGARRALRRLKPPRIIWDRGIFCATPCSIFAKTPLRAR
jgi:hypothetical protein